jgi:hypothetical protein
MTEEWLYDDPKNVMIITTKRIVERVKIVKYISHDDEDGMWQFLDCDNVIEQDARIISLEQMTALEPDVKAVADLPLGWIAWREDRNKPWMRIKRDN